MTNTPNSISVLGGGAMGLTCAHALNRLLPDTHIDLYDPAGFPAPNASYMAGGMLAPLSELDHMDESYLPAGFESIALWSRINDETDGDFEFSARGSLFITHDEDRHLLERFKSILPESGWSQLSGQDIQNHEAALPAHKFRNGLFMDGEAHLHPQKAMHALVNSLRHTHAQARKTQEAAQDADWVIDCRGMGAKTDLPTLRGVKGETVVVRNPDFHLSRPLRLMHPRYPLYIVPRADNIFMIGATIIESEDSDTTSVRSAMELLSALYSIHPSFGDAEIIAMRAGVRPSFPDNLPTMTQNGNIITCNGLYRHGFLFSPVMAECVAHLIAGKAYAHTGLFLRN